MRQSAAHGDQINGCDVRWLLRDCYRAVVVVVGDGARRIESKESSDGDSGLQPVVDEIVQEN